MTIYIITCYGKHEGDMNNSGVFVGGHQVWGWDFIAYEPHQFTCLKQAYKVFDVCSQLLATGYTLCLRKRHNFLAEDIVLVRNSSQSMGTKEAVSHLNVLLSQ